MIHREANSQLHATVWRIAAPMILANVSTPLLGLVDTVVMGHLKSPTYLGAIAIGSMIFTFLFWGFGFLRMATTGQTAQAFGADDQQRMQVILMQSIWLAMLIGLALLLVQHPIRSIAFDWINASTEVKANAADYFNIRIWSAPATLVNYAILGWLIGKESPRQALLVVLAVNVSNAFLDTIMVYQFHMKADGVALASVIAEYIGLAVGIGLISRHGFNLAKFMTVGIDMRRQTNSHWQIHTDFMIRTLCLIFSFAFFTIQGAKQGTSILAANSVLLNFITFTAFVLDGFANATEVLSGKAIGRKDSQALRQCLRVCCYWSLATALLFSLTYYLFGTVIISLLTDIENVRQIAFHYLPWVTLAPVIGVWSYLLDGLFVGATRGKEMRNTMLFATFCCYLPAWYLLTPWQNHGLWLALLLFLAARAVGQAIYLPEILSLKSLQKTL